MNIEFESKSTNPYQVDIHIAGNLMTIEEVCAEFCERGACVSITPQTFVYTAGRETGAKVTFISYARFPKDDDELFNQAEQLARLLLEKCHQHTCTIIDNHVSLMLNRNLSTVKEK